MANSIKDSITTCLSRSESLRGEAQDFLIKASQIVCHESGDSNGMNRYYQLQVNSTLSRNRDDFKYLLKLSDRSTKCIRCGHSKTIKFKSRKPLNKSVERHFCRYLRAICDEHCDRCNFHRFHKSIVARAIVKPKLKQGRAADTPNKTKFRSTAKKKARAPQTQSDDIDRKLSLQVKGRPKLPAQAYSSRLRAFTCLLKE